MYICDVRFCKWHVGKTNMCHIGKGDMWQGGALVCKGRWIKALYFAPYEQKKTEQCIYIYIHTYSWYIIKVPTICTLFSKFHGRCVIIYNWDVMLFFWTHNRGCHDNIEFSNGLVFVLFNTPHNAHDPPTTKILHAETNHHLISLTVALTLTSFSFFAYCTIL